jgi:uncharacterized protein YndB with AHSA1/START domain
MMLAKILLVIILAFAVLVVVALGQPDSFRVQRTAIIDAPAPEVYKQIYDLHKFNNWNPWARVDPNAIITFEGAPAGANSIMRWDGNHEVGKGAMILTGFSPDKFVQFRMEFLKPMKATSTAEFTLVPKGDSTEVTWVMYGSNNFMGKVIGLFMDCDKIMGDQFEQGLKNLNETVTK